MEELQKLLDGLKKTLATYEQAEREVRDQLEQVVQGRLMQAGAVRGVEMAIKAMEKAASGLPAAGGEGNGSTHELSTVG